MAKITLKIEGELMEVDRRFAEVSQLLNGLINQGNENEVFELSSNYVTKEVFEFMKSYYEFNQFKPTIITSTNPDEDALFLNAHDKELMKKVSVHQGDLLKRLITGAVYMNMEAFEKLCIARIVSEYNFDKHAQSDSLAALAKKYPQVPPLTAADIEHYKKQYPHLTALFK